LQIQELSSNSEKYFGNRKNILSHVTYAISQPEHQRFSRYLPFQYGGGMRERAHLGSFRILSTMFCIKLECGSKFESNGKFCHWQIIGALRRCEQEST